METIKWTKTISVCKAGGDVRGGHGTLASLVQDTETVAVSHAENCRMP